MPPPTTTTATRPKPSAVCRRIRSFLLGPSANWKRLNRQQRVLATVCGNGNDCPFVAGNSNTNGASLYRWKKSIALQELLKKAVAPRLTSQMQQHTTARMAATTPPRITVPTRSDAVISFRSLVDGNDMLRVHVSFVVVRIGQGGVCKRRANIHRTLRWNHTVTLSFGLGSWGPPVFLFDRISYGVGGIH